MVIACNHLRAPDYYAETINSQCPFEGYQCRDYQSFEVRNHINKTDINIETISQIHLNEMMSRCHFSERHELHLASFLAWFLHVVFNILSEDLHVSYIFVNYSLSQR